MGNKSLSLVALTPTVQCGTTQYWMWNIFFILILSLMCSIIAFIAYATTKARNVSLWSRKSMNLSSRQFDEETFATSTSLTEKFGLLWRESFRDEVPWWTAVELFVRLVLIAIFSLSITRLRQYSNLMIGAAILGCVPLSISDNDYSSNENRKVFKSFIRINL